MGWPVDFVLQIRVILCSTGPLSLFATSCGSIVVRIFFFLSAVVFSKTCFAYSCKGAPFTSALSSEWTGNLLLLSSVDFHSTHSSSCFEWSCSTNKGTSRHPNIIGTVIIKKNKEGVQYESPQTKLSNERVNCSWTTLLLFFFFVTRFSLQEKIKGQVPFFKPH